MKFFKATIFIICWCCSFNSIFANPIVDVLINEIYFDSGEWTIELHNKSGRDFMGCYIKTSSDSAYFRDDLYFNQEYLVLTKDSLQSNLIINRLGDTISLRDSEGGIMCMLNFGLVESTFISSPKFGQSICSWEGIRGGQYYYLDQSPTIGAENDTVGANGVVEGTVTDTVGVPIKGVKVIYDYEYNSMILDTIYTLTDSAGRFSFNSIAYFNYIKILKNSYESKIVTFQVWPEEKVILEPIVLSKIITNVAEVNKNPEKYFLLQNYPNPFNPSTKIKFTIPVADAFNASKPTLIKIYDILGTEVETLVDEQKPTGTYEVEFDGAGLPSGIYFYKLQVGNYSETKKMLLMK